MATIRWFGAAAEAAGSDVEPTSAATLGDALAAAVLAHPPLEAVLARCSVLIDGVRTSDPASAVGSGATIDVLPPFAGG
ncbi:MAG TPA: MoaD/ThiS family protein [Propionibacteriaceae bacterium]|nr:MoaD/ThiS family protein [Propionibacteriaceae bacterium]